MKILHRVFLLLSILLISASGQPPLRYTVPDQGRVDARLLATLRSSGRAHFLINLRDQPPLKSASLNGLSPDARAERVVSSLRQAAAVSQPGVIAKLHELGITRYRTYWISNTIAAEGDAAAVFALASLPEVQTIEPDAAFHVPLETVSGNSLTSPAAPEGIEWNINMVRAPELWQAGFTGQGITVAGADTGVDWQHPILINHYRGWNGTSADHNDNWWDAIHESITGSGSNPCGYNSQEPCDDDLHGTHTMGTMVGDDGQGSQVGMAPGARWIACRNMDAGTGRPSTYIECLQFLIAPTDLNGNNPDPALRADVINNSYGCPPSELCVLDSIKAFQTAVEAVRAAGIFMAVSAGNDGLLGCSSILDPPGTFQAVFSVGAVDSQNSMAGFSSRGPVTASNGSILIKPNLVAPGVNVLSSIPGGVTTFSGTSMAAPHVAGAVALLWSAFPELRHNVDLTEQALKQSAVHVASSQVCGGISGDVTPNNTSGYGRLDVKAAYDTVAAYFAIMKYRVYLPGLDR